MIRTVGELREALRALPDEKPCYISVSGPRAEKPCSFEDEYGPGTIESTIRVLSDAPGGAVLLCQGESPYVAVGGAS